MLPKKYRLKNKNDFKRVYEKGTFFSFEHVVINFTSNNQKNSRFGFVVGKNYNKNSTERNRARRILRNSIIEILPKIIPGKDFVIGIKKHSDIKILKTKVLSELFEKFLRKHKLIIK